MKRRKACFSIILAMLMVSSSGAILDVQDPKNRIVEASNALFNSNATKETLVDSLIQFLDVSVVLTSTSQHKDEITHHVDVAKDLIENTSLFNEKARQYISMTYRMITNGQKYQKPKELDEFVTPSEARDKAMKYAKKLVSESLLELELGHNEKAAQHLLELVLMIVTPVSG